jgi:hypothetical protein
MAAPIVARVLLSLIQRHGLNAGVKIAQRLGFKGKSIQKAFKTNRTLKQTAKNAIKEMDAVAINSPERAYQLQFTLDKIAPKLMKKAFNISTPKAQAVSRKIMRGKIDKRYLERIKDPYGK